MGGLYGRLTRRAAPALLLAALWCGIPSRSRADEATPKIIFEKVATVYRNLQACHLMVEKDSITHTPAGNGGIWQSIVREEMDFAILKPSSVRLQVKQPQGEVCMASNGAITWQWLPQKKEFTRQQAASRLSAAEDSGGGQNDLVMNTYQDLVLRYTHLAGYASAATLQKDARIKVSGRKADCYVVALELKNATHKLWIDKQTYLVLRHEEHDVARGGQTQATVQIAINLKQAEINQTPDPSLFTFSPPAGWREVQTLNVAGLKDSLLGKQATDFALKTLDGDRVQLSDYRGKVVVLDFWATWCPPCRKELPRIQQLYEQNKDKGIVVLAINDETGRKVKSFLKEHNYNFPVLMDQDGKVHRLYAANTIPNAVVVDRSGTIVAHLVGLRPEPELQAALAHAGL